MVLSKKFKAILIEIISVTFIFSLFIFLAAKFLPSSYSLSKAINLYDEGILITGAKRIVHGEIPYRDFWAIYTPLNYITLSATFKFFGESIFVERIYNLVISLMGLLSIYWLFRTKTGRILAGITCLLFLFFPSPLKLPHLFIFLTLISIFALIKSKKNQFLPYILGVCVGLTFATRLDFGLLVGLVSFITTIILFKWDYKKIIYSLLKIFAGFMLVLLPILIWLGLNNALGPFFEQVILYPFFGNFVAQRNLPIPDLIHPWQGTFGTISFIFNWGFWIFTTIFFALVLFLGKLKKTKTSLIVFGLLFVGSLPYLFQRSDNPHLVFVNILGLAFFYYVIFSIQKFKIKYYLISLIVPFLLFYYPVQDQLTKMRSSVISTKVYSFYTEPLLQTGENDALESTLEYVTKNIDINEPIYVGVTDHSKIFISNVVLYFLLSNEIPTMYHELHPGVVDSKEVQKKIIDEIKQVKYIILWDYFYCEPNESCISTEVYILDEYVENNYSTIETFGEYQILMLNN